MNRMLLYIGMILLGGCGDKSTTETIYIPDQEDIIFTTVIETKGIPIVSASDMKDMGVFCYYTGESRWDAVGAASTPNKMCNLQVTQADGKWSYGTSIKWGAGLGFRFSFFGYSPYPLTAPNNNGVIVNTTENSTGAPTITFTVNNIITDQVDLLVATPRKDLMPITSVSLRYNHALSRIGFSAKLLTSTPEETVTVENIKIHFDPIRGEVGRRGTLNLETLAWSNFGTAYNEGSLDIPVPGAKKALSTTPQMVIADNGSMYMIPQDISDGSIAISMEIKTVRSGIADDIQKYENIIIPAQTWKRGSSYIYNYVIDNGTKTIKLSEVSISDWTTTQGGNIDI